MSSNSENPELPDPSQRPQVFRHTFAISVHINEEHSGIESVHSASIENGSLPWLKTKKLPWLNFNTNGSVFMFSYDSRFLFERRNYGVLGYIVIGADGRVF